MPPRFRRFLLLLACALSIQLTPLAAEPPGIAEAKPQAIISSSEALEQSLTRLGYTRIPLEREKTRHLVANVQIEGKGRKHDLRLVIDNGSSVTLLTPEAATKLGLEVVKTNGSVGGVGGTGIAVSTSKVKAFKIGPHEEKELSILIIDISHVNAMFAGSGQKPLDGVIGSDWMQDKKALIDMESARMFVLPSRAR